MIKLHKKILLISILLFGIIFSGSAFASEKKLDIYIFSAKGCPHCADEKLFLEKIEKKYDNIVVHDLEVTENDKNRELFQKTLNKLEIKSSGVPLTVIEEKYFIGFGSEESTGKMIEGVIREKLDIQQTTGSEIKTVNLPVLGEIDVKKFSLPVFTIIIGGLDGFNPCSMWVLLFLISLLLGMEDRKKMWILGSVFILSSAAVYFLFMAAWLNLFLFLGVILWVRLVIAGVAIFSGVYYLRDYFVNKEGECKVDGGGKKKEVFDKLKEIVHKKTFWWALLGIMALAFLVNLVELICSVGLPAVFTQVLAISDLPIWRYYAYLLLYIFFFMLDDLIVFILAMITFKQIGISGKYSRYSRLIGGILITAIGLLLIFKPEWLMFG